MRCSRFVPGLFAVALLVGCGQQEELRPAAAPTTPSPWGNAPPAPAPAPAVEPPPAARPRLSQTITLGQEDYSPNAQRGAPGQGQGGNNTNVTVNNNIVVQPSPPIYYGGYYGGYGSYGGYGGYGGGGTRVGEGRSGGGVTAPAPWAPSGWEGAQRTAAPGQTPGVGGNWAPPPSSGPRPMR